MKIIETTNKYLSNMETERLRQFCAIADMGSLTKAAEVLNISLGGLSKSIKVLEDEIGFPLFLPSGRGLAITERGLSFYGKARKVLDTVTALTNAEESANNPFRIGVLEVFSVYFMGKILAKKFAGRRMELVERSPGEIEMLLLDRQIECGLTYLPYPQPGIEVLKIGGFELHAFAKADVAKGESAEEIPFIIPTTGLDENPLGIKERDGWPDAAFRRNRFHKTNMLSTALDMARNGLGAVFMPDFVAKMHNESHRPEFQLLPIESSFKMPRIKRQLFLLKRTGAEETGEIKKLVAGVREQIREK